MSTSGFAGSTSRPGVPRNMSGHRDIQSACRVAEIRWPWLQEDMRWLLSRPSRRSRRSRQLFQCHG
jgi:hypothetical protein